MLEVHLQSAADQISAREIATGPPMAAEFVRELRAEAGDQGEPAETAQPLVTVAANLAQLELVSAVEYEKPSPAAVSVTD